MRRPSESPGDAGKAIAPPPNARFAVVVSRFNEDITSSLLSGCVDFFHRYGVWDDRLEISWVPGAFEIPVAAHALAESGRFAAVVALGCVIRGETDHYQFVAGQSAAGVMHAALTTGVPVIFGVLTTETLAQAQARAGPGPENKGAEAAAAAIEMAALMPHLRNPGGGNFGFSDSF